MTNQTLNFKNICSGIGLFSSFLILNGYELKAESLSPSEKKYVSSNKIKWVLSDDSYRDNGIEFIKKDPNESNNQLITKVKKEEILEKKEVETIKKDPNESNNQLITKVKKEEILEKKEVEVIEKINQKSNLSNTSFQQSLDGSKNIFLASKEEESESNVLISEIIIEGWEDHPEGRKLELAAYDSMSIKPGSIINNRILKNDLDAIYASGWFSGVKIESQDGPLGVRLIVNVVPNPVLKKVEFNSTNSVISNAYLDNIFSNFYGKTLNINELQNKIEIIKKRYESEGYSLARISGPDRISDNGIVILNVSEGIISDIKFRFLGADGDSSVDGKPRKGKTKDWVIKLSLIHIPSPRD